MLGTFQDAIQFTPSHVRSARLANFITALMKFKNDIDRQTLAPVRILRIYFIYSIWWVF